MYAKSSVKAGVYTPSPFTSNGTAGYLMTHSSSPALPTPARPPMVATIACGGSAARMPWLAGTDTGTTSGEAT
jgi:hypothetical protein